MGLAGSLHCVGMCGPIAMSLPLQDKTTLGKLTGSLLYNTGRITTYAAFGLVFGLIGKSFSWFGWQQKISISLGVIILLFLFIPKLFPNKTLHPAIQQVMFRLRQKLSHYLFQGNPASLYATGLLNGLLPCGLVYMALAGATVAGQAKEGMLFMIFFGTGYHAGHVFYGAVWKLAETARAGTNQEIISRHDGYHGNLVDSKGSEPGNTTGKPKVEYQ